MRTRKHDTHFFYKNYAILSKPCDSQNFYILNLKQLLNAKSCIILIFFPKKVRKFKPCDSYKLYSYKKVCVIDFQVLQNRKLASYLYYLMLPRY